MRIDDALLRIQSAYPRVYLACHTRHATPRATGEEVSQRDSSILAHLSETSAIPQGLLTRHLGIAKSTLSEALSYLEERGLVSRSPDPADPRGALVKRTQQGAAVMSRSSVLEPALLRAVLAHLNPDALARAVEGLELLAEAALRQPKGES